MRPRPEPRPAAVVLPDREAPLSAPRARTLLLAAAVVAVTPTLVVGAARKWARIELPAVAAAQPPSASAPVGPSAFARPLPRAATEPLLRVPLMLNRSESALLQSELVAIVEEVNRIWQPAGICFEVGDIRFGYGARSRLVLWFVAGDAPFVNGYFESNQVIWSEDAPRLRRASTPAKIPAARTAAHELGHALGLKHLPRAGVWMDGLMNTGYDGYHLEPDEILKARREATELALGDFRRPCRPPML
jgi:hypothetical protein